MVWISKVSCLTWLMVMSTVNGLMNFETKTKEELVKSLMANNGDVEYQNISATSAFSQCARLFSNGYTLGNAKNETSGVLNKSTNKTEFSDLLDSNGNPIPIVPDKGVMLSSGTPENFNVQNSDGQTTAFSYANSADSKDWDLQQFVSYSTFDACWIKFQFRCTSDAYVPVVSFNYVFGSEEYYEYVNSAFNDAFAFFLNGVNIARLPDTETSTDIVSINNVNYAVNTKYFHGNDYGNNTVGNGPGLDPVGYKRIVYYPDVEADGITTKLTARGQPKNGWNTIKLVVADVGDAILDSWVLLESGTFTCVDITSAPSVSSEPSSSPPSRHPTAKPTNKPTGKPTNSPTTQTPTSKPTIAPTRKPTTAPTKQPTTAPTKKPTSAPTKKPTSAPTRKPTRMPTKSPTSQPSISSMPSSAPTSRPSNQPSSSPSLSTEPSLAPSESSQPSTSPSVSSKPSSSPSISSEPSLAPSESSQPTSSPSISSKPSSSPSISSEPSLAPSESSQPTSSPSISSKPSFSPTETLSSQPSSSPSVSSQPSQNPSMHPSVSSAPSFYGSLAPSVSSAPSESPTDKPSKSPTQHPTKNPTGSPTVSPSTSQSPSMHPSEGPSVSSKPSVTASSQPSVSSMPSESPTSQPSVSSSPSESPSEGPSVSSKPSLSPTSQPSLSSSPSSSPSEGPSVSSKPSATASSQPSVSLAPSISPASIGPNYVFDDKNGNGVQDEGEPGIPGVLILLYNDGVQEDETTSGDDGSYEFTNLPAGTYYIEVVNDPKYTFSPIVEGGNAVDKDGTTEPVPLELGENVDTWNVGMYIPVSLGNKVFNDLNGNAIQDAGEPGIAGVTVTLVNEAGGELDTQETASDGSYFFDGLPPGSYAVKFEIPDSYAFTPPNNLNMDVIDSGSLVMPDYTSSLNTESGFTDYHSLTSGDVDMTYDAAIFIPVSVSGITWHDLNANGILDDGEPGLEGSTIVLYNDDGDVIDTQISGPDGTYLFENLPPDGYYSYIMPPSPEYLLSPSGSDSVFDPTQYMSYPVTLLSGESGDSANAGLYMLASVGDWVWDDSLANGIQDADEVGFEGPVTINLYDSEGKLIAKTQTDETGSYNFAGVMPGDYEIEFILEEGNHFTTQNAGEDDTKDSDVDPSTGKAMFTVVSGEEAHLAAGVTVMSSVGPNQVFNDNNGNGIQDEGEPGQPGVTIHLIDGEGNRVATTISGPNGYYGFDELPPGNYHVQVELESGYSFSPVVEGGNQITQVDGQPYGTSPQVELLIGEQEDTWSVGLIQPVTVGNKVWNDLNGNGIQDAGEPGMPDVTAILVDGSGTELDRAVTDENGLYLFEGLAPGEYAVKFEIPDEYLFTPSAKPTTPITNEVDGSLSYDDVTSDVNVDTGITDAVFLNSGEENLSFDAGIFIPVNISGATWHDLNANGIQEEGEPGLPGSTVTLYDRDGDFVGVQVTDSNGNFLFEGLPPGTYHTVLTPPSPEYLLSPNEADNDSDFNPENFKTSPLTLNSGESGEGSFDAGLYLPASIGDKVWYDEFPNGLQDGDEKAFDGPVAITLYDSLGFVVATTVPETGSGSYHFDGLTPGTYELMAVIDELGYVFTMQNKGNNTELDSDVNPTTGKVKVTLISGEENNSIDIGIMDDAPYYPDWENDSQVCTNDGFDPSWLEIQRVNYLYKNKEECCKRHFWWRITQCMQNEEFKFYKNGEICDTKIYFEDWESNSPADWTKTTQFDTLDECCVNMFWYDIDGCMARSPVMFKFEFCVDVKGLVEPQDCQSADVYTNVLEDAINAGINYSPDHARTLFHSPALSDMSSDAYITSIGNVTLTKDGGSTTCGGSLEGQAFINDKTGQTPDIAAAANTITTVCGVITVEDGICTDKDCMLDHYQNLTQIFKEHLNDGSFASTLNELAEVRLPPVPELQTVTGVADSFTSYNLLLPSTITGEGNFKFYHGSDLETCMEKTVFLATETPYETLYECCSVSFHYDIRTCCLKGGGCPELGIDESKVEYFPTWDPEKLCDSKLSVNFDAWESQRYETIEDCCKEHFDYQYDECVSQHAP